MTKVIPYQLLIHVLAVSIITNTIMIKTTSLKHYKALIAKGITCELVTKSEINK